MEYIDYLRRFVVRKISPAACRFARARKSSTAVEFAIVGMLYFFVLFFAIEGGVFYLKVDILDLATERAARFIILNNLATAPTNATAFAALIASNGNGALTPGNIAVSVQMVAPISGTATQHVGGFQSLTPNAFTAGTYQYVAGACPFTTNVATGVVTVGTCTGDAAHPCAYLTVPGEADQGYQTTDANGVTKLHQTYTCSAGQDIYVQVQYTDSTLTKLVASFFGPVIATMAFQAEPTLS